MERAEPTQWRYSTLHQPGWYRDDIIRRAVYWSGVPPIITKPWQSEASMAAQMRALGWRDAEPTPPGRDKGVDIRAQTPSRAIAQVKMEKAYVTSRYVQQLVGAAKRGYKKDLLFFASSGYTQPAIQYADENSIMLFTYSETGDLTPVNHIAVVEYRRRLAQRDNRIAQLKELRARRIATRDARLQEQRKTVASPLKIVPTGGEWDALFGVFPKLFPREGVS